MEYSERIARKGLEIGAMKFNFEDPFQWTSGFKMPIYTNCKKFIMHAGARKLITGGFKELFNKNEIYYCIVAGTSTAGISPGTSVADALDLPFVYVRDKQKSHGMKTRIEGIEDLSELKGERVVVIEDVISTGGSSAKVVQTLRDAGAECDYCFSIFSYGFDLARWTFEGDNPYDSNGNRLTHPCNVESILDYDTLLRIAQKEKKISQRDLERLGEWRADPFGWGAKNGF